jgi:YggT family protein
MTLVLALTRSNVADYVEALFIVFTILILFNILLSWMPRIPFYSRWFRACLDFITDTTNPYLGFFRRLIPSFGSGAIDLSPMVGLVVLLVAEAAVVGLLRG